MSLLLRTLFAACLCMLVALGVGCLDAVGPVDRPADPPPAPGEPTTGEEPTVPGDPTDPTNPENPEEPTEPNLPPPPPPPPAGTVLYERSFEESNPFDGWRGRRASTNLQVIDQGSNKYARLIYEPHADWRISFLPRHEGVFDLRVEFSYRLPHGFEYRRYPTGDPKEGQIIGGGKHVFQLSNVNTFEHGNEAIDEDGWCRLDFGAPSEFGYWDCVNFAWPPHSRGRESKKNYRNDGDWFVKGRWHTVRTDIHLNSGPGDDSGTCDLWIDGDHKGTFHGEFNVIGNRGGLRVLGFGNFDNLRGEPWVEIDNLRVEAL